MDQFDEAPTGRVSLDDSESLAASRRADMRRIAVVCPDCAADAAYFAAALARQFVRSGSARSGEDDRPVVLIDGQPGTGGLDVLVDLDTAGGARWAALRGAGADVDVERLLRALPERDGVRVLSHGRGGAPVPDADVRDSVVQAVARHSAWMVTTMPPHETPVRAACDAVALLVRGTVCSMAAAQQYVDRLDGSIVPILITLEADAQARVALAEALDLPVVTSGPTRWRMGAHAAEDVLAGRWPGENERAMTRLVQDVAIYVRSAGRSLAWV